MNKIFTEDEISDLERITNFFKKEICINANSNFNKCYSEIPHEYLEAYSNGFYSSINFDSQKSLYNEISKSAFDEIWMFCKSSEYPSGFKAKRICAVVNGKFHKYLKELGKENFVIAEYAKRISALGDFWAMDFHYHNVLNIKNFHDLDDPNLQLVLAIHYLSLNDHLKRKENWTE